MFCSGHSWVKSKRKIRIKTTNFYTFPHVYYNLESWFVFKGFKSFTLQPNSLRSSIASFLAVLCVWIQSFFLLIHTSLAKWTSRVNNNAPSSVFVDPTGGADDPNRIVLWSHLLTQGLEVAVNLIDRRPRIAALGWREAEKVYVGRLSWETDGDEIHLMPRMFWKISMLTVPAYVGGVYIGTMFSHWSHPRSICFLLVLYYAGCICST